MNTVAKLSSSSCAKGDGSIIRSSGGHAIGSIPLQQGNTEPDLRRPMVVVDQAFAVPVDDLQMPAHPVENGESPVELQRTVRTFAATQGMAAGQGVLMATAHVDQGGIATTHVLFDVGVVVVARRLFGDPPPRP